MAKEKGAAKADEKGKKGAKPSKGAADADAAAKLAKKEARKEALKNRPEGQRPNSKQVDTIQCGKTTVDTFAYPVRKTGSLITTVVKDEKGNAISASSTFIPGTKAKVKKGHGALQPGNAGEGKKKGKDAEGDDEDED